MLEAMENKPVRIYEQGTLTDLNPNAVLLYGENKTKLKDRLIIPSKTTRITPSPTC